MVAESRSAQEAALVSTIREQEFSAYGGRLIGRPDVIYGREIIDYKSGSISDYNEDDGSETVKVGYIRQLRIYGYLVREAFGWWPERGLILPLLGAGVDVTLDPAECEREAHEAVAILEQYNGHIRQGVPATALAAPSPEACRWCPYQLVCPAFWRAATPTWSSQLRGASVEGIVPAPPRIVHGGAAMAVSVDVQAGSEPIRRVEISPLDPTVHEAIHKIAPSDRVRMVDLRKRPDGALLPTVRTVLARVDELPEPAVSPATSA
jgi:hypothetical protein